MRQAILQDLARIPGHPVLSGLTNRGFHALLSYGFANWFWKRNVPLLPLAITRIIQILNAIDIDYRAKIQDGTLIIHGTDLVIGSGAQVGSGAKLLGGIHVGDGAKVGANPVVFSDVPAHHLAVGVPARKVSPVKPKPGVF